MADLIELGLSKTYEGDHMVELFLKPMLATTEYASRYRVIPDVVGKKNIYFRERTAKIMKKITNCTWTTKGALSISDKELTTTNVGVQVEQCWAEFKDTVFEKEWLKRGTDKHDLTGTQVETIFQDYIREGIRRDIARVLWWGDENAASNDWDWFDGWMRIMLDHTTTLGHFLNISAYETGTSLNVDAGIDIMENLIVNAPSTLWQFGKGSLRFYVSRGIYHNYTASLRGTVATDSAFNVLVNGINSPAFDGIPIEVLPEWDEDLADSDNPITNVNTTSNNAVLLTTPENLVIGVDGRNVSGNDARIWYSMDDDVLRGRFNMMLGAEIFIPELMALAI